MISLLYIILINHPCISVDENLFTKLKLILLNWRKEICIDQNKSLMDICCFSCLNMIGVLILTALFLHQSNACVDLRGYKKWRPPERDFSNAFETNPKEIPPHNKISFPKFETNYEDCEGEYYDDDEV